MSDPIDFPSDRIKQIPCNLPFERLPNCGCDEGVGPTWVEQKEEITRLRSLLDGLVKAVEPFANAATNNSLRKDLEDKWPISYLVPITYGDLRRAREAYLKAKGE